MHKSTLDVLLVHSPSPHPGSVISYKIQGFPPLGLGYMAAYLKREGFSVEILDFYIDNVTLVDLQKIVSEKRPKIIGISATTETYNNGIGIAKFCKKIYKESIIVMGGPHVTFEYESALKTDVIDLVIRHEGEETIVEAAKYYIRSEGKLSDILGISYKADNKIIKNKTRPLIKDLDSMPFPDRELLQFRKYPVPGTIVTSRGCPGRCIFCAAAALSGGQYRSRSAESVVEEMAYLKSLGINYIYVVDDTMTADIERLEKIISLVKKRKLKIDWGCESRVDIITPELLKSMKEIGCISLQFGVETGTQEMLDSLKKGITMDQIQNAFLWARDAGIKTSCCLIIGTPFDTRETIKATFEFAKVLQSYGAKVVFTISTPFPGTYMYKNAEALGMTIYEQNFNHYNTSSPVYHTSHLTGEEIQRLYFDGIVEVNNALAEADRREETKVIRDILEKRAGYPL